MAFRSGNFNWSFADNLIHQSFWRPRILLNKRLDPPVILAKLSQCARSSKLVSPKLSRLRYCKRASSDQTQQIDVAYILHATILSRRKATLGWRQWQTSYFRRLLTPDQTVTHSPTESWRSDQGTSTGHWHDLHPGNPRADSALNECCLERTCAGLQSEL